VRKNLLFSSFGKFQDLVVGVSQKQDGSMKLDYQKKIDIKTESNRNGYLSKLGIDRKLLVSAKLNHTNKVVVVSKQNTRSFLDNTDGLITSNKNIFLSITIADCLPIFLYDPSSNTIGLLHAGWRGLSSRIIDNAISIACSKLSINLPTTKIGIGPAIGVCHYEIKDDLAAKFAKYKDVIRQRDGKKYLDLKKVAKKQLLNMGILKDNIEISSVCTFEEKTRYFSYRRDNPKRLQAMMAVIGRTS